jgi:hypothetical protein
MFFLQVFFYICLWIVEVFSRSDVIGNFTGRPNFIEKIDILIIQQNRKIYENTFLNRIFFTN